jgi:protein MpaA
VPARADPVLSTERIGRSVEGRPIAVTRISGAQDVAAGRRVLVVGCVHGDECAGRAIVARLLARPAEVPRGAELLLVRNMNPDGFARGTRQNARGVDLNRNALTGWRPLGPRGTRYHAGPRPWSEPESRAIRALLLRERPDVVVWYHQPLGGVDVPESGWDGRARRYARATGLPVRPLPAYPGSLSRWANARVRPGGSFVVELRAGRLPAAAAERHARAVLALVAS